MPPKGYKFTYKRKCKHGLCYGYAESHTPLKIYKLWQLMKSRCLDSNHRSFPRYGGRGIKIFHHWINNPKMFIDYCMALPSYAPGLRIDRIDNDGNYEPGNIRFVTSKQNSRNMRSNVKYPVGDRTLTAKEIWEEFGQHLTYITIVSRLKSGLSVEETLAKRPKGYFRNIWNQSAKKVGYETFRDRLRDGWDITEALNRPKHQGVPRDCKFLYKGL